MYFILTIDNVYDFGISEPEGLSSDLSFISGKVITEPVPNPMIYTTDAGSSEAPPDFWDGGYPVASEKMIKILEGAGVDNLQKYPAVLKSEKDDFVWEDYSSINVIGMIQCADLEKSEYTEIFPGNYSFRKLIIDDSKVKDALMFRLQESPSTIIVHQSVGKYMGQMDPDKTLKGWAAKKVTL